MLYSVLYFFPCPLPSSVAHPLCSAICNVPVPLNPSCFLKSFRSAFFSPGFASLRHAGRTVGALNHASNIDKVEPEHYIASRDVCFVDSIHQTVFV